jgi:hypothetical protein
LRKFLLLAPRHWKLQLVLAAEVFQDWQCRWKSLCWMIVFMIFCRRCLLCFLSFPRGRIVMVQVSIISLGGLSMGIVTLVRFGGVVLVSSLLFSVLFWWM